MAIDLKFGRRSIHLVCVYMSLVGHACVDFQTMLNVLSSICIEADAKDMRIII